MHFRCFSSLFWGVVLPSWASFCELYEVSIQVSKNLTTNDITHRISYSILFSRSQPSHPYVGCHLTRSDPNIFISWVLFLVYDTGMVVVYGTTQSGICWKAIHKWCWYWWPLQLWKFLSLFQSLIRVYNFSEIIQIAREVYHTSWKLFIETVSPIYNLSSFFSK